MGLGEGEDGGLVGLLVEEVVWGAFELVCGEIQHCNGIAPGLDHYRLTLTQHPKRIHGFLKHMLKQHIPFIIHMRNTILSQSKHP